MQDMTLEHVITMLKETYENRKNDQSNKYFPWDRGYLEGYADGIGYAYELLSRVKSEEPVEPVHF